MANPTQKKPAKDAAPERVTVLFHDHDLLKRVDAYSKASRRNSRSNAIEALVAQALDAAASRTAG